METRFQRGSGPERTRFNGATAFRQWKRDTIGYAEQDIFWLQWGHRLSAVETRDVGDAAQIESLGFNGATAFRQWKRDTIGYAEQDIFWLQWGHRLSAVETYSGDSITGAPSLLQWGHRLSAVET